MRLIDVDELIKRMQKWMPKDPCGREQTVEEVVATDIAASVFMEIEETPTAFDKEKVIEELKDARDIPHDDSMAETISTRIWNKAITKSIKIVEKGGIEWT